MIKYLPYLETKPKERPLCYPYSVKARALLHAHFQRLELPSDSLAIGKYPLPQKNEPQKSGYW